MSQETDAYAFAKHARKRFGALGFWSLPVLRLRIRPHFVQEGFDSRLVCSVILEGVADTLETIVEILQRTLELKDVGAGCWRRC